MSSCCLLQQDEYHMLHLVCASRTPPSSPKPRRSHANKPQVNSAGSTVSGTCTANTFLLFHQQAYYSSICNLFFLLCYSPFKPLIPLPLLSTASPLQHRATMDSDSKVDLFMATICIYSLCKGNIISSTCMYNFLLRHFIPIGVTGRVLSLSQ